MPVGESTDPSHQDTSQIDLKYLICCMPFSAFKHLASTTHNMPYYLCLAESESLLQSCDLINSLWMLLLRVALLQLSVMLCLIKIRLKFFNCAAPGIWYSSLLACLDWIGLFCFCTHLPWQPGNHSVCSHPSPVRRGYSQNERLFMKNSCLVSQLPVVFSVASTLCGSLWNATSL